MKRKARSLGLRKLLSITTEEVPFKFKEARKNLNLKLNARDMHAARILIGCIS